MAYNDEALKSKLSTLNDSQESIESTSSWMAFHRRHADKIAQLWLARLRETPPPKSLYFLYLVNHIVQNAKHRKRAEFPAAFSPLIPEAVQTAYKSSPKDLQVKIQRLVDVWKTRNVFEASVLQTTQVRIDDVDKTKAPGGKKLMGGSLFSSSSGVPKELESLIPLQTAATKAEFTNRPLVESATDEYTKVTDQSIPQPSAPVHAANLSSLIKKLAAAEAGLEDIVKARKALVTDLKRRTEAAESALSQDETLVLELSVQRTTAETNKRDVEDSILRGLTTTPITYDEDLADDNRPDVEELTPEPDEMPAPPPAETTLSPSPAETRNPNLQGILAGFSSAGDTTATMPADIPGSPPLNYPATTNGTTPGPSSSKKRKLSHDPYANISADAAFPDLGTMGVTGFDGTSEQFAAPGPAYADPTAASYHTVPSGASHLTANTDVDPNMPGPSAMETPSLDFLEQDVDALIAENRSPDMGGQVGTGPNSGVDTARTVRDDPPI